MTSNHEYKEAAGFFRDRWKRSAVRFTPAEYRQGRPAPGPDGNWILKPWPDDFGPFAERAAQEMLQADPDAFPADVVAFAAHLRHAYILESAGLPIDPEGLNVVRLTEALVAKEGAPPRTTVVRERLLAMVNRLTGQITVKGTETEMEEFRIWCLDRAAEGKDPFADTRAIRAAFPGLLVKKGGKPEEGGKR